MASVWTARDVPDQQGRVVVLTGANSGLGMQASLELARHGAHVVMACRSLERGEQALDAVRRQVPDASVVLGRLDLADLASVSDFAGRVAEQHPEGINVLLANAGVMAVPRGQTADGFELQLGTNHLGHFALAGLLLPSLLMRPGSRVVSVSSVAHHMGRVDFADLMGERRYRRWGAYGQSKLANLLFTYELDRRARAAGTDLVAVAAHPGVSATNLVAAGPLARWSPAVGRTGAAVMRLVAQSDAMGALPVLYAAAMPDVGSGEYFGPGGFAESRGHPRRVSSSPASHDEGTAARLWAESERLTGVTYDLLDNRTEERA